MRSIRHLCTVFACATLAVAAGGASRAAAATFVVDTTADGVDASPGDGVCATADGHCALRAAIEEANALPGPDTVRVPAGTYLIAREGANEDACVTGDLDVTSAISIVGAGAAVTIIDANHRDRVFDVHATGAAVISGVTIENGNADDGGGIRVKGGVLRLVESTVTTNQSQNGGGAIFDDVGSVEIIRSTLAGNVTHGDGGALDNTGTATLRNVTVSGNTADGVGGGIANGGTVTLNNVTVTANTHSGVHNESTVVFMNSIVADNAGPDCEGTLSSRGFNLVKNPNGCTFDGDTSGDLLDKVANLAPLADNGGPTFTHALLAGSAALDAADPGTPGSGDPTCETTDQRGVSRPQGPRCDIGAFEACGVPGSADGGFTGSPGGAFSLCARRCGDGTVDPGEECDHGATNGAPGDTCDASCHTVPPPAQPGTTTPACGDGNVDPGEECDDGNRTSGDGCDGNCMFEAPISCDQKPSCESECNDADRFSELNCVLQTPVCKGEHIPFGLLKRLVRAREFLALAQNDHTHETKLVKKASRMLGKCQRLRGHFEQRGKVSGSCASELADMLAAARGRCQSWLGSL